MAQKTVILDSSPSIPLHIPSNISLNVSPAYSSHTKQRGQPLLGQKKIHYTHFVPMGEGSQHIKELLGIPETDTSESKPIEGYKELLKAEKIMKGEEKHHTTIPSFDLKFEKDSKDFIETPQNDKEDTFEPDKESVPEITPKNDAAIATLIASSQPKKNPSRKPSKPKRRKSVKKTPKKPKKMKKYRIMKIKK